MSTVTTTELKPAGSAAAEVRQEAGAIADARLDQLATPANPAAAALPGSEVLQIGDRPALVVSSDQMSQIKAGQVAIGSDLAHGGTTLIVDRALLQGDGAALIENIRSAVLPLLDRNPDADTTVVV